MKLLVAAFLLALVAASGAAPSFNKTNSYRFLYYAYAAYNMPTPGAWNCPYCTNYTKGFVQTVSCHNLTSGAYAYVGYNPNYAEIVASYRGSSDIQNWIEDLDAIKTPPGQAFPGIPNALVEQGFYYYYESVKTCVVHEVKRLMGLHTTYKIAITGHSLGAAGSMLSSMDLVVNMGVKNVITYNFGEPRLGNKDFYNAALTYQPTLQRMVDNEDCVPKLPPQALGYHHEAYEVFETPTGGQNFKVCDSSGEDPTCSDNVGTNCNDHLIYMGVPCCDSPDAK